MRVDHELWSVRDFLELRERIEQQPLYQRRDVWTKHKRQLLIDSLLRGLDIPMIYLRRVRNNALFDYSIIDGQQRLSSIWRFADATLLLGNDLEDAQVWAGCAITDLDRQYRRAFRKFEVVVAVVSDATDEEVRELFERLQMGERLTPAELRNSIRSALGSAVRAIADTHEFFVSNSCTFSPKRYKHHDLTALAFCIQLFRDKQDVKAPNLRQLYLDNKNRVPHGLERSVIAVLNYMHEMLREMPRCITRKWTFVDVYHVLSRTAARGRPAAKTVAQRLVEFEAKRLRHVKKPEVLLRGRTSDEELYRYIQAFKASGGIADNVKERYRVLRGRLMGR